MKKALIVLCVLALAILACGGEASTSTPESAAFTACTMFVESQLRVSRSDAQRYAPELVVRDGTLFTVQVYYASLGTTYQCLLDRHDNGDMELMGLSER